MGIATKPFQSTRLEEERSKDKRITFTLSLNKKQMSELEEIKLALDIKSNSVVMKLMLEAGKNAFFRALDVKTWKYIVREKRSRYSEYKDIDVKIKENASQDFTES